MIAAVGSARRCKIGGDPMTDKVQEKPGTAAPAMTETEATKGKAAAGRVNAALRSPSVKFFSVGLLVLLMLIPLNFTWKLVREREQRAAGVVADITASWGSRQNLRGPVLVVPYTVEHKKKAGYHEETIREAKLAAFLPETLDINGKTASKVLHRSIFTTSVYTADMKLSGRFAAIDLAALDENIVSVDWANAVVAVNLSSLSSLKNSVMLKTGGGGIAPFEPGIGYAGREPGKPLSETGIHARPFAAPAIGAVTTFQREAFPFEIELAFTGAEGITIVPVGRTTKMQFRSDWPHPSFLGAFLPDERKIDATGFEATWSVPHLARSFSQTFDIQGPLFARFNGTDFGVSLVVPVDTYDRVERALKYGILFIAAAFGAALFLELMSASRIHAVQYVFVGIAMVLFYVMLLSLSEHVDFARAYAIAAGLTGLMLAIYAGKVLHSFRLGLAMALLYAVLYGVLYLILQMEDYALLAGSISAFVILTLVMFTTLKVDWSGKVAALTVKEAKA